MDARTTPVTISSPGRQIFVLLIALLAVLVSIAPALAASPDIDPAVAPDTLATPVPDGADDATGPDDPVDPGDLELAPPGPGDGPVLRTPDVPEIEIDPTPQPTPKLVLTPSCDPAGFSFGLGGPALPEGAGVTIQWRKAPDGPLHTVPTAAEGFVDSGQGHFKVRAVVFVGRQPVHRIDWTDVVVRCRTPRPTVTIDVAPTCDAGGALDYEIHTASAPQGPLAYKAQWRVPGGDIHTVDGQSGRILTGEGSFEIRGVMQYQGPGFYATDFVDVVVDCPDDVPDIPDDTPRPGIPTFTG